MSRVTRSKKRKGVSASPATTVPSPDVSPVFSANPSVKSGENSPETSDIDEDNEDSEEPLRKKVQLNQLSRKLRSASSSKDIPGLENRAYVEIVSPPRASKDKGKQKVRPSSIYIPVCLSYNLS